MLAGGTLSTRRPAEAAATRLYTLTNGIHRACNAGIEESGPQASFTVAAKFYARCIDAFYEWNPGDQSFTMRKFASVGENGWADVEAVFTLGSPTVHVYVNDKPWKTFNVRASTGVVPYERAGDLANMVPWRFINDLFRLGSRWDPEPNVAYTLVESEPLDQAPLWDRQRIESLGLIQYGELVIPESGSPLLPSTDRRLRFFAPFGIDLAERAEKHYKPYQLDWTCLCFRYMNFWGEKAATEFTVIDGDYVTVSWFHNAGTARDAKAQLEKDRNMWESATGYTSAAGVVLAAVSAAFLPEATIPLAVFSGMTGTSWVTANRYYSVKISDIGNCIDKANDYSSKYGTPFAMGLRTSEDGVQCLDHYH